MNITIYTNSNCGYCKQLKDELNKNDIEFKEKLISEFTVEWQDVVNLTGLPTTPTVKYKEEYFVPGRDYQNPQQLINILQSFPDSSYDYNRRAFGCSLKVTPASLVANLICALVLICIYFSFYLS